MADRYTDRFLNALMYSHQIIVRGELWYNGVKVGPLDIVAGSISGDRSGSVRRTANITLDPSAATSNTLRDALTPFGSRVKVFRGVRYGSGAYDEIQVFYGRIDAVDYSLSGLTLTCSDLAADVMDARFLVPTRPGVPASTPGGLPGAPTTVLACIKALITDVHAGMPFNTSGITDVPGQPFTDPAVAPGTNWPQERGDALDSLCTQLQGGCEWFIDMEGTAHVHPLPAVIASDTDPAWIVDSGDVGVLVERVMTADRSGVFNGVTVSGEPVGGKTPAVGTWKDDQDAASPTHWGGPFGKVVNHYSGMQLSPNTTAGAEALAKTLGLNSIASVKSVKVTCVPNPKLKLGDVVRVYADDADINGMYFVQTMELPLAPEDAMTMTLYSSVESPTTVGGWRYAAERNPEGATWQPTR